MQPDEDEAHRGPRGVQGLRQLTFRGQLPVGAKVDDHRPYGRLNPRKHTHDEEYTISQARKYRKLIAWERWRLKINRQSGNVRVYPGQIRAAHRFAQRWVAANLRAVRAASAEQDPGSAGPR